MASSDVKLSKNEIFTPTEKIKNYSFFVTVHLDKSMDLQQNSKQGDGNYTVCANLLNAVTENRGWSFFCICII